MRVKEALKIVCERCFPPYVGIEASAPNGCAQYLPKCEFAFMQKQTSLGVVPGNAEEFLHDAPESILRVGIVLAGRQ